MPDTRVSGMDHIKQSSLVQVLKKLANGVWWGEYRTGIKVRQVVKHFPQAQILRSCKKNSVYQSVFSRERHEIIYTYIYEVPRSEVGELETQESQWCMFSLKARSHKPPKELIFLFESKGGKKSKVQRQPSRRYSILLMGRSAFSISLGFQLIR